MPLTDNAKIQALDAIGMSHVGLHTAYPGNTGAAEVAGGTPAYARKAATFGAAAGSPPVRGLSAAVTGFDVPAGVTVKWVAAWSALTGGSCRASAPAGTTIAGAATIQAADDIFRSDGHGLPNDRRVVFYPSAGEALPTGVTEGADYFVINTTADTFQISLTQGGAAINLTGDGEVFFQDMIPATDALQFKLDVPSFPIDLNA
jgi:hypothetical protein